jgi:hypothetical protein
MNVKFKDGVYGFVWENDGTIGEIFTEPLSDKDIQLIYRTLNDDYMLIVDDEDFMNCFTDGDDNIDEDDFYNCTLDKVMEFVK